MWVQLIWAVVAMIVSAAIQAAMAPKPPQPTAGNLDVPEPQPGRNLPVCFGTNIVKDANVYYFGNAYTVPIRQSGGKK